MGSQRETPTAHHQRFSAPSVSARGDAALAALVALPLCVLALPLCALSFAGCGNYDPAPRPGAGGTPGETTSAAPLNGAAINGTSGSSGQAALGGSGTSPVPVEASCSGVTACGGDLAGTWVAAGSCLPVSGQVNMAGFGLSCTAAPVTGTLEVSGAWTANLDGTFKDTTTTSGESEIQLPPECLNISGTTTTCDRLDGALQALGYATVTCADAASGGCTCTGTVQQTGGMGFVVLGAPAAGSYTTANNVITTAGRNPRDYSYCVSGNRLTVTPQGVSNTGSLTGTIVFEKQ